MPAIKLNVWESMVKKGSKGEKAGASSGSRKRRKVVSDEYESASEPENEESEGHSPKAVSQRTTRRKRNASQCQSQAPEPDKLFDDDANVDIVNANPVEDYIPDRAPTPTSGVPAPAPSRKRSTKKKAATAIAVSSDEDADYVDSGKRRDDDFVVESPPRRGGKRGGGGSGAGRGRGKAKEKAGGIGEIHIKDERKLPPPPPAETAAAIPDGDVKAGTKRRRETVSEPNAEASSKAEVATASTTTKTTTTTAAPAQSSSTASAATEPSQEGSSSSKATTLPPSNVRKLPPIKKNKNLAGATSGGTAPSSGLSTPFDWKAASAIATDVAHGSASGAAAVASLHSSSIYSLPRKPVQKKTQDIDLSSPDIYNSLFKTGSGAPRVGVNSRLKEEERRKELMKMRDEARAARGANLQKHTFDLLAAHAKITRFEVKMRARNSPALYPNHLGCGLKVVSARRHLNEPMSMNWGTAGQDRK